MPITRDNHLRRALFEQRMADRSATHMARTIHQTLADLHSVEAEACIREASTRGIGR